MGRQTSGPGPGLGSRWGPQLGAEMRAGPGDGRACAHTEPAGQEPRRGIPCPLSPRPGNSRFSWEELCRTVMAVSTAAGAQPPINRSLGLSEGLCCNPGLGQGEQRGYSLGLRQSNNPICSDWSRGGHKTVDGQ